MERRYEAGPLEEEGRGMGGLRSLLAHQPAQQIRRLATFARILGLRVLRPSGDRVDLRLRTLGRGSSCDLERVESRNESLVGGKGND
jgi:hypothetical protein